MERIGQGNMDLPQDKKPNLLRALYSIGMMCRHFDFDSLLSPQQKDACGVNQVFAASNGHLPGQSGAEHKEADFGRRKYY